MESKFRDSVLTSEPGKYSIREIECRTSICAIEVASLYGTYLWKGEQNESLNRQMMNGLSTWGYETDSSGSRITVTVMTFERR